MKKKSSCIFSCHANDHYFNFLRFNRIMQISFNLLRKREGEEMGRVWIFHNQMIKYVNYGCREYIFQRNIANGPRRMRLCVLSVMNATWRKVDLQISVNCVKLASF